MLCQHLDDAASLRVLAMDGLDPDIIPTEEIRGVFDYAMHYYYDSGQEAAPSMELLQSMFEDVFADNEIDMDEEPPDTIEWVIEDLKSAHVQSEFQVTLRNAAAAMNEAPPQGKIPVLNEVATGLIQLSIQVEERGFNVDLKEGVGGRVRDYIRRTELEDVMDGLSLPFPEVNNYTFGIHPGELAVLAGAPKVGKSYFMAATAWAEYQRGRAVVLNTLENSIEETIDRIICLAASVSPSRFQEGNCSSDETDRIVACMDAIYAKDTRLMVCQPDLGKRSVEHLVRDAQAREADSLLIDQLSFLELPKAHSLTQSIGAALHTLKNLISTGRRMPCLLANQVSREGMKLAEATGHLEMWHMADSAEVERTVHWLFALYQTRMDRGGEIARLQTLASRRQALRDFLLHWSISTSTFAVMGGAQPAVVDQ